MPNGEAHEALIRQAYGAIGLDLSATAMVEAHGKAYFLGITLHSFGDDIDNHLLQAPGQKLEIPLKQGQLEDVSERTVSILELYEKTSSLEIRVTKRR